MSRGAGPERATTSEGYYYQRSRVIHPPPNLRWGVPVSGRRDDGCRSPDYVAGHEQLFEVVRPSTQGARRQ